MKLGKGGVRGDTSSEQGRRSDRELHRVALFSRLDLVIAQWLIYMESWRFLRVPLPAFSTEWQRHRRSTDAASPLYTTT
jgi:hypothetical protein